MFNWPTPGDRFARCNAIPLRTGTSQATTKKGSLKIGAKVTVVSRVSGGKYGGTCQGIYETGTYWFRVKAINGTSVRTLYGVSYVYIGSAYVGTNPPAGRTEGIDVSHWQGTIDWTKVRAAGKRFAFIKASDGQTYDDPNYPTNRTNAKAAGLLVGAYHFAKPDTTTDDATKEADHFIATAQWTAGELKPVLDLEQSGSMAVADLQTWVKTFLSRIYSRTGVRAVIYVSPYFWTKYMGDTDWFAKNGYDVLWIAHWTTASGPSVSATNWGGNGWTFWQYTSDGSVPGIGGRVDLDRYNGYDFSKVLID
jgi:GH25 family lysozyme M1 (1,4-beta-N-acetylmuramidase)